VAWRVAVGGEGPVALVLSRQDVPVVTTPEEAQGLLRGAYVLRETAGVDGDAGELDLVLIGTGSEVAVCLDAAGTLEADGLRVRVVSMPSWDLFDLLDPDDQEAVLPTGVPTLAVEAGSSFGWGEHADDVVSIDRFGASAPGAVVLDELGINPAHVVERAHELLDAVHDHEEEP
jgi:transketolase